MQVVPFRQDVLVKVVTLVVEPENAGIVIWFTEPTAGKTDCKADICTSTLFEKVMLLPAALTVPKIVAGVPVGVVLPNSGTTGMLFRFVPTGTPKVTVAA